MNYCTNCGNKVDSNAFVCTYCGVKLKNDVSNQVFNSNDKGGIEWSILGFFVPIVGLILYLVWKDEKPKTAKSAGKGALVSVIFNIVFYVILFIFGIVFSINSNSTIDEYDDTQYHFE